MASKTSYFQMGPNTLAVPMSLFRNNRARLVEKLRNEKGVDRRTYVLLQGGTDVSLYDTDVDYIFRQESYFNYLFGVKEPGCYGTVHVQTGRSILFVPRLPEEYAVWMGHLHTLEDFQEKYEVDEVRYANTIDEFFRDVNPSVILTLVKSSTAVASLRLTGFSYKPVATKLIVTKTLK